jgi:hypothetical protein
VAGGYSYELDSNDLDGEKSLWGQVYGLLEARLKASGQFDKDYQLAAGTQLGWLYQGSQWQMNAFASYFPAVAGEEFDYKDVSLSFGGKLSTNVQVRLEAKRELISSDSGALGKNQLAGDSVKLGMNWYF